MHAASQASTQVSDALTAAATTQAAQPLPIGHDAKGARGTLAQAVQACLTRGGLPALVARFDLSDSQPLQNAVKNANEDDLNARIAQVRALWSDRYHQDFHIPATVFEEPFLRFEPGSTTATTRPSIRVDAGGAQRPTTHDAAPTEYATATLTAMEDEPELRIPFRYEQGAWRIGIAKTLNAEDLRQRLLQALNALSARQAWPTDPNEGYRLVAHTLLGAVVR